MMIGQNPSILTMEEENSLPMLRAIAIKPQGICGMIAVGHDRRSWRD
jgi:hypothetical protein